MSPRRCRFRVLANADVQVQRAWWDREFCPHLTSRIHPAVSLTLISYASIERLCCWERWQKWAQTCRRSIQSDRVATSCRVRLSEAKSGCRGPVTLMHSPMQLRSDIVLKDELIQSLKRIQNLGSQGLIKLQEMNFWHEGWYCWTILINWCGVMRVVV